MPDSPSHPAANPSDRLAEESTLLKFPCKFPLKVVCEHDPNLVEVVREILLQYVKDAKSIHLHTRESSAGNYFSITATFIATSKWQLDQIYQALSKHPKVKMTL